MPSLHIDFSCAQDLAHLERGIPVYARDLSWALLQEMQDWDVRVVLNSDEAVPPNLKRFIDSDATLMSNTAEAISGADVFLDLSPFYRAGLPKYRISQKYNRVGYLVHDLIPFVYPEKYFPDQITKVRHKAKLERLRHADFLLSNSPRTTSDIKSLISHSPEIFTVGTGVSEDFVIPTQSAEVELQSLKKVLPGIREGFLLYTGGSDWRKNIEGLISAYSSLHETLRSSHQLVVVCSLDEKTKAHLTAIAAEAGAEDDLLLAGHVEQETLIRLYQLTDLFVFPSLYEGYGLPVAEALKCGARVICGNNSNLISLIPDENSRFDSRLNHEIANAIARGISREIGYSAGNSESELDSWQLVAGRVSAALRGIS